MDYSKTCVKRLFQKDQKNSFQDGLLLNAGQKYCRKEAFCNTFELHKLSLNLCFVFFLSGNFTQVLLYMVDLEAALYAVLSQHGCYGLANYHGAAESRPLKLWVLSFNS